MKLLYSLLLLVLVSGCHKNEKNADDLHVVCIMPGEPEWMKKMKQEYAPCTCQVALIQGIFNNQPALELRITDPLCNGINTVYKADGTVLLSSVDKQAYANFLTEVKGAEVYWTCTKVK